MLFIEYIKIKRNQIKFMEKLNNQYKIKINKPESTFYLDIILKVINYY